MDKTSDSLLMLNTEVTETKHVWEINKMSALLHKTVSKST